MAGWLIDRTRRGWCLERSRDGLARVVDPHGLASPAMSIGKALAYFSKMANAPHSSVGNQALLVHGMLGERESFGALASTLNSGNWACHHVRYASYSNHFHPAVKSLQHRIERAAGQSGRLCLLGHSFGCRLIAAALKPVALLNVDIVFIAPPTRKISWAKRGMAFAPARRLLGGSLAEMAQQDMALQNLVGHNLLVIEGRAHTNGDGWLRSDETDLKWQHQRVRVDAGHSALLCDVGTQAAIAAFLKL